jgi:hypothetical protein
MVRTVAEEIAEVRPLRPHLVLLGAGASRAALPNGDAFGRVLPLMKDFVTTVPRLPQILERHGIAWRDRDFEHLYAELTVDRDFDAARRELEGAVEDYFSSLVLPEHPTIYDVLLLSLRAKDVVATFNWDPFLIQAFRRNYGKVPSLPHLLFLHGNVMAGFCAKDGVLGVRGAACSKCGVPFARSKLLYPVATKDYQTDPMIAAGWREMQAIMRDVLVVTVFGYSAPTSDTAAIDLLAKSWGGSQKRQFEEFEIIDVRPEPELRKEWDRFIHTHHYQVIDHFRDSWIINHPRRTVETFIKQVIEALFVEQNPAPLDTDFAALWSWFRPLSEAERRVEAAA